MNKYWIILQGQYKQLAARVNQAVLRERVLLLLILITIIYALWSLLFVFPGHKKLTVTKSTEAALVEQVALLQQKISAIEKNPTILSTLDKMPSGGLISESALVLMFKSLLAKHHGVALKGLHSLPNKLVDLPANYANVTLPIPLYEQGVVLNFDGGYSDFYEYLHSLENLKWMLFWDELQYTVTEYPNAEIKLTVYTVNPIKKN